MKTFPEFSSSRMAVPEYRLNRLTAMVVVPELLKRNWPMLVFVGVPVAESVSPAPENTATDVVPDGMPPSQLPASFQFPVPLVTFHVD